MKLSNSDLQKLYISHLEDETPQTRKKCPSPKELLYLFRTKKSIKNKNRIIDHVTNCIHCANEIEFILEALRYERNLNAIAKKTYLAKKENPSLKISSHKLFSFRYSWKFISLLAVTLSAVIFIVHYISSTKLKNPTYRTTPQSQIRLIYPDQVKISKSSLFFKWEKVMSSDYYLLEIFNESLFQIWKSPKISECSTKLPNEISNLLEKNKIYFWMITAFFANGKVIESHLQEFYLTE